MSVEGWELERLNVGGVACGEKWDKKAEGEEHGLKDSGRACKLG